MKVMFPQVLVVLWLGLTAVVGGSRVDGGGKPVARKSVGPRDVPALPPAVAPGGGTPAVAPAGPPALPDTSDGVPPAAALPVAAPADVVADEVDEYRGFQDHWFDFAMPSFCQAIPTQAPAARGPLTKEHAATWRDLAPYIRKTLTRRDGGGDNRFLAFFRHAASPESYNAMATEALGWIVSQRTEDAREAIQEAIAAMRQDYTEAWMRKGFPADVAAEAWAILEADLVKCWEARLNTIVEDFKTEAKSQWTVMEAGAAAAVAVALSSSKSDEGEDEGEDEDDGGEESVTEEPNERRRSRDGASTGVAPRNHAVPKCFGNFGG